MTSIRSRLSAGLTIVLALLLVGQWLWLTLTIDQLIEKQVITRLQDETQSLLAKLSADDKGELQITEPQLSSSYQRAFSGLYFVVHTDNGQILLSRSLWDFTFKPPQLLPGEQRIQYLQGPAAQPLLAVSMGYSKQNLKLTITVAEDIDWMLADKRRFQFIFSLLSLSGLIALVLLQAWIIRRTMRPLSQAQQQLQQLGQGEREQVDEQAPEEIRPLLTELNRLSMTMLARNKRSRQALGNLAHRLKTHLSLLNQLADSVEQADSTRIAIHQQTEEIRQIIDRELKRARVAGMSLPGRQVELTELLAPLVDTLQKIYQDKSLIIDWQVDANVGFHGDREDLLELLGNLLDNACKWCQSRVHCVIRQDGGGLDIMVADDGPGCDLADLSSLMQRGFRADESKPGTGLGLAIVFDIAESYGGRVSFDRSPEWGGLQVQVHLQSVAAV